MITCLIGEVVFPSLLFPSLARAGTATISCVATTAASTCFAVGKYFRHWDKRDSIYTTSIQDVSRDTAGGGLFTRATFVVALCYSVETEG
jgi:hypothetical protein